MKSINSNHLEAIIKYALEQVDSGGGEINPLAWGDTEVTIGNNSHLDDAYHEITVVLNDMLQTVEAARGSEHCELYLTTKKD